MTTNITPIQALEKIIKILPELLTYSDKKDYLFEQIGDIATQALAPQECDVAKCRHSVKNQMGNCCVLGNHLFGWNILCEKNPNCYYKQLHSQQKTSNQEGFKVYLKETIVPGGYIVTPSTEPQQKTFTVEEVKKILNRHYDETESTGFWGVKNNLIIDLLAEFEKAVE